MANTSAIRQQAAHTTYQLPSAGCTTRAMQKSLTLYKKRSRFSGIKYNGPLAEKCQDTKSKRPRQKNERGDRKGESNDSPKILDKGETLDTLPGLPQEVNFCVLNQPHPPAMAWETHLDHFWAVCVWVRPVYG